MTAVLNVTYNGESRDIARLDYATEDEDIVRIAAETMEVDANVFNFFVVDRFDTEKGGRRIYLRPKVPFGQDSLDITITHLDA
jgi:hypothetical protein